MASEKSGSNEKIPFNQENLIDFINSPEAKDETLDLTQLEAGTVVGVETETGSLYKFLVTNPDKAEVVITGGKFFPHPAKAEITGSNFPGSTSLVMKKLVTGFRMEIVSPILTNKQKSIQTSPMEGIFIDHDPEAKKIFEQANDQKE